MKRPTDALTIVRERIRELGHHESGFVDDVLKWVEHLEAENIRLERERARLDAENRKLRYSA